MKEKPASDINYIFTEEKFYPEIILQAGSSLSELQKCFQKDRHRALYQMGFGKKTVSLTPAGGFLYLLSETFIKILTGCPELERKNIKLELTAADMEELLSAVPFSIGAEYVTCQKLVGKSVVR